MLVYDANVIGPNPYTVRLFAHERGGLSFQAETIDLANLANRGKLYRSTVNPRGEVPALRLDDGRVVTEITAVCEYFDEMAAGGRSLIGETPEERATVRMWTRRVDMEIAQPMVAWWRGGADAEDFYRGNRTLSAAGQRDNRLIADRGLNQLDDDLIGLNFLCGDRPMLADILLYGFMGSMLALVPWLNPPSRRNVAAWFQRMADRPTSANALIPFESHVSLPPNSAS
jgi:glutathione S-transferase